MRIDFSRCGIQDGCDQKYQCAADGMCHYTKTDLTTRGPRMPAPMFVEQSKRNVMADDKIKKLRRLEELATTMVTAQAEMNTIMAEILQGDDNAGA
jgi:hypothetical protein